MPRRTKKTPAQDGFDTSNLEQPTEGGRFIRDPDTGALRPDNGAEPPQTETETAAGDAAETED